MMDRPKIILRTPDGLSQITFRRLRRIDFDACPLVSIEPDRDDAGFYAIAEKPLEAASAPHRSLHDAWQALGNVHELSDTVRAHVETVLGVTAPGPAQTTAMSLPPWPALSATTPRPTAAHPRAYQGTTDKPPRPKSAPSVDLRPYLCDPKGQDWLLTALGINRNEEWMLPAPFRVGLWPLLREQCPADVPAFLALYWALRLDERPALRAAVSKLVSLQADTKGWLQFVTEQAAPWQELFVVLLIESKVYTLDAQATLAEHRDRLADVRDGKWPFHRLFWLLRGLVTGLNPVYMMAGYRMSDLDTGDDSFAQTRQSGYFPETSTLELMAYLKPADDYYEGLARLVWRLCGELPGLGEIVQRMDPCRLVPDVAYSYLRLFVGYQWQDLMPEIRAAKWAFLRGYAGQIEEQLHSIPAEYQQKWVAALKDFLWFWDDPAALANNLPHAFALLQRLARPPFRTECDTSDVTSDYLGNLSGTLRERFLAASDASFRQLEQACQRRNNHCLIGGGTWALTRLLPELAVASLVDYPGKLCKVAKLLGCLPGPMVDEAVTVFGRQPIMADGISEWPLSDIVSFLDHHCGQAVYNPVPRQLREHLAGIRTLTMTLISHYRAQTNKQLTRTRLEMLEAAVLQRLAQNFGVVTPAGAARHALQLYFQADDENRRGFQKFLKAHWDGQRDYLHSHPRTQAWIKRHPGLDIGAWQQGITLVRQLSEHGAVQLAIEQDPLEALKLGTYVGSCLGLGGSFSYSAVAIVLDVNKQVIYARDAEGNVIARQTVAVSEEERLVCFEVYPVGVADAVKQVFADFDQSLAQAVGLPIHDPLREENYEISHILSHDWWDDCAWDLTVDGTSEHSLSLPDGGVQGGNVL